MGRNVSRSSLARANGDRDYHIFEAYAYYLVNEARQKRVTDIFKLGGNVYAFDSTTIDLCLSVFWWAKFRKKKGGIKVHTLYDVETQIPASFHIIEASVHDSKAMNEIPYESGSYYIFDRAYNNFKMLYRIHQIGAYFVVRAKKNLQYMPIKWKHRLPKNVFSDMTIGLTGFYPKQYYPEPLRLVRYWDEEQKREFVFLTNAKCKEMFAAQGGDTRVLDDYSLFEKPAASYELLAEEDGYIVANDAEKIGSASVLLGAGRQKKGDPLDFAAGIILHKKRGDYVHKGESLATFYGAADKFDAAAAEYRSGLVYGPEKPEEAPLVYALVTKDGVERY